MFHNVVSYVQHPAIFTEMQQYFNLYFELVFHSQLWVMLGYRRLRQLFYLSAAYLHYISRATGNVLDLLNTNCIGTSAYHYWYNSKPPKWLH